jgi:hypothetical protein
MGTVIVAGSAYATTATLTASIKFYAALTVTNPTPMNFGVVQSAVQGAYTITPAGVLTASTTGGNTGVIISGTPAAAEVDITGDAIDTVTVTVNNSVTQGSTTLGTFMCAINTPGTGSKCDGGSSTGTITVDPITAGKVYIGATASVVAGTTSGETDSPTFDVVVSYS